MDFINPQNDFDVVNPDDYLVDDDSSGRNISFDQFRKSNSSNSYELQNLQDHIIEEEADIAIQELKVVSSRKFGRRYGRIAGVIDTLNNMECNPIEGMIRIALNAEQDIVKIEEKLAYLEDSIKPDSFHPSSNIKRDMESIATYTLLKQSHIKNMSDMLKELAQYSMPKLRAIEHSGTLELQVNPLEQLMKDIEGSSFNPDDYKNAEDVEFKSV